jgi:hypothetical protein
MAIILENRSLQWGFRLILGLSSSKKHREIPE